MGLADFFRVSPEVAAQDARMRELREVEKTKRKAERERREAERMAEKVRKQRERQAAREQRDAYLQELKDYVVAHESELVTVYEGIHVFPDVIMRIPMFTWTSSNSMLGEPARHPMVGVSARVEVEGEVYARATLTRAAVPGMHGWQKKVDEREAVFVVEGPDFMWQFKLQPQKHVLTHARDVARKITHAGNAATHRAGLRPQTIDASGVADELRKLAELRDAGILSPQEFEIAKSRVLG